MTPADVEALARAAQAVDGSPPVNDQALVEVRSGEARVVEAPHAAAVLRSVGGGDDGPAGTEVELVVHPDHRREGLGALLVQRVLD